MKIENIKEPKGKEESSLLWDEYKYRHDLIWKQVIRSVIAVIGLITLPLYKEFKNEPVFIIGGSLLVVFYMAFNFIIIGAELKLLDQVKDGHRKRQYKKYDMHKEYFEGTPACFDFEKRVYFIMVILSILAVVGGVWNVVKCFSCI